MIYYKKDTVPLERDNPGVGERSFDKYGNLVEIGVFEEGVVVQNTVLEKNCSLMDYESFPTKAEKRFLKTFWILTNKSTLTTDEVQNTN